jgi:regulator of protease activity HflC (stomatin/prohibitin superfamily)
MRQSRAVCNAPGNMSRLGHVLSEYECAVVLHRARPPVLVRSPGSVRTFWRWKRVVFVDLRPFAVDVLPTEMLTKDHVALSVSAKVGGSVIDPVAAALRVVDYEEATKMVAETAIRAVLKERPSDELGSVSAEVEAAVVEGIGPAAQSWGVAVSSASIVIAVDRL